MEKHRSKWLSIGKPCPRGSLWEQELSQKPLRAAGMNKEGSKGPATKHKTEKGMLKSIPNSKGITQMLPIFNGQDNMSFISWLNEIKCYFRRNWLSDLEQYRVVVSCLKGDALLWLKTLNLSRNTKGKSAFTSWYKLESHMKERYIPVYEMSELKNKLEEIRENLLSLKEVVKSEREYQSMCQREMESKPEFNEPTELGLTCSPGVMNCVSNACITKHLTPIESKHQTVDHERSDEGIDLTHSKPLQLPNNDLIPTHCENKNPPPNMNPKETIYCVNAKPNTLPNIKTKLKDIQTSLEPETKTKKQVILKTIVPHTKMNQPLCRKSLPREKMKCFLCQGVGHLRKDCPSNKTTNENPCSPDNTPELPAYVEKSMTNTNEIEDLLVENSLVCTETVECGNIEDQTCEQPYLDDIVVDNVCNPSKSPTHLVESLGEGVSQVRSSYTDKDLNLTEIVPMIDACTIEHLHTTKVESVNVPNLERKDVSPVITPLTEKEPGNISIIPFGAAQAVQVPMLSTYISPLDVCINKRLQKPMSLDVSHYVAVLDEKKCWSPNKNEPKEHTYFNCSRIPSFIPHIKNCPNFSHGCLRNLKCILSMPHFHFYMLRRMKISLVQLSATSYTLAWSSSEHGTVIYVLPRWFLLVYDPGGVNHDSHLRMQIVFTPLHLWSLNGYVVKEVVSFIHQNLRSNSFQPGEVAAGARPKGLSFLMTRKVHEVMSSIEAPWCPYLIKRGEQTA